MGSRTPGWKDPQAGLSRPKWRTPSLADRMRDAHYARRSAIEQARRAMRGSFPRLQMFLIVGVTGLAGLAASVVLRHAGIDSMALRYPASVGIAYLVFLLLLWVWLRTTRDDWGDLGDFPTPSSRSGNSSPPSMRPGDGDFSGAGASGTWEPGASLDPGPAFSDSLSSSMDSIGNVAETVGEGIGADESAVPVLLLLLVGALVATLACTAFYVIWIAPALLAELAIDGGLSYVLYRGMRDGPSRHWLVGACRRTAVPFATTAAMLAFAGLAMSSIVPGARSVGEVVHHRPAKHVRGNADVVERHPEKKAPAGWKDRVIPVAHEPAGG